MSISQLPDESKNLIFESGIYFTKESELFSRSFKKIQELAAEVGGIIKIFMLFSGFIVSYYSETRILYDIMNESYDFENLNFNKKETINYANNVIDNNSKPALSQNNKSTNLRSYNHLNIINKQENVLKTKQSKFTTEVFENKIRLMKNVLSFKSHLLKPFLCSKKNRKQIDQLHRTLKNKLDIFEYIKMKNNVDNIKAILLNEKQNEAFNFLKNESYNHNDIKIMNNPNTVIEYFSKKLININENERHEVFSEIDKKLYERLNKEVKAKIELNNVRVNISRNTQNKEVFKKQTLV
jgi:hypothetical protein